MAAATGQQLAGMLSPVDYTGGFTPSYSTTLNQGNSGEGGYVIMPHYDLSVNTRPGGFNMDLGSGFFNWGQPGQTGAGFDWNKYYTPSDPFAGGHWEGNADSGGMVYDTPKPGTFNSDQAYKDFAQYNKDLLSKYGYDPNGQYIVQSLGSNPSTPGSRDTVQALYQLNKETGQYDPVNALNVHHDSAWVGGGRQWATSMALAALGGAAAAGLGAAGAGAGGASGATNAALAESAVGSAGYGASSAGLGGLGAGAGLGADAGMSLAEGGYPSSIIGSNATNPALIESAVGTPGYGMSSAGMGGGAGTSAWSGLGSTLKDLYNGYKTIQPIAKAVGGATGGGGGSGGGGGAMFNASMFGGMSPGDRYRQQLMAQSLRDAADRQGQPQGMPGWIPGG